MTWWIWIITGLVLLALELFMPSGFFIFFIGIGFILTGITTSLGILDSQTSQIVFAGLITVALALSLRKRLLGLWKGGPGMTGDSRSIEGQMVTLQANIAPGGTGIGVCRGASWTVRNNGAATALAATQHSVVGRDGLTIFIEVN